MVERQSAEWYNGKKRSVVTAMLQAAIVEDDRETGLYLRDNLTQAFDRLGKSVAFDVFEEGKTFLSMFQEHYHYDMLFLDIEMPQMSGFELCRRVREIQSDALVIFISSREELVFQSFEVQPFRFIRKSSFAQQAPLLAQAVLEELQRRSRRTISVTEPLSHDIYTFDALAIKYVEASNKDCMIHSTGSTTAVRCKFSLLEQQLADEPFIKVHRSYLVNCNYISYIGRSSLSLTTGENIPISRGRAEYVKHEYMQYLAK